MIDPANFERYLLWLAANGDNRSMSWAEICSLPPEDQHDFSYLSRIHNRLCRKWRKRKEKERKDKADLERLEREARKGKR